jgi:hypothetical protein
MAANKKISELAVLADSGNPVLVETVRDGANFKLLCNLQATAAPTVTNDSSEGYSVGSPWNYNGALYIATDVSVGASVWVAVGSGGDFINRLGTTNLDPTDPPIFSNVDGDWALTIYHFANEYTIQVSNSVTGEASSITIAEGQGIILTGTDSFGDNFGLTLQGFFLQISGQKTDFRVTTPNGDYSTNNTDQFCYLQRLATQNNTIQRSDPAPSSTVAWDGISDFIFIDNATPTSDITIDIVTSSQYSRKLTVVLQSNLTGTSGYNTTGFTVIGSPATTVTHSQNIFIDTVNMIINFFD